MSQSNVGKFPMEILKLLWNDCSVVYTVESLVGHARSRDFSRNWATVWEIQISSGKFKFTCRIPGFGRVAKCNSWLLLSIKRLLCMLFIVVQCQLCHRKEVVVFFLNRVEKIQCKNRNFCQSAAERILAKPPFRSGTLIICKQDILYLRDISILA